MPGVRPRFARHKEDSMLLRCFHQSDFDRDWSNYLSRGPRNQAEFEAATQFILGHFTTTNFLSRILEHGLMPDEHKDRAVDDNVPSDSTCVYLATTYDRFYINRATRYHGGEPISIEVRVDKTALLADEGQLSPRDLATLDPEEALYVSMCGGACKHRGTVPLKNILSICDAYGSIIYPAEPDI
jgi:hypothetical protein